jgi:hypothetical protein
LRSSDPKKRNLYDPGTNPLNTSFETIRILQRPRESDSPHGKHTWFNEILEQTYAGLQSPAACSVRAGQCRVQCRAVPLHNGPVRHGRRCIPSGMLLTDDWLPLFVVHGTGGATCPCYAWSTGVPGVYDGEHDRRQYQRADSGRKGIRRTPDTRDRVVFACCHRCGDHIYG